MILWFWASFLPIMRPHTEKDNCLSLNVSKNKELIVDFRKRQQRPYTPLLISGTPVERVSSFKYLGVYISEDLTWTTHIQTQVKKARQDFTISTAEEIQGLTSNPENFLFRGHRKCIDSVHLSVVWKRLQSGLQSSAESVLLAERISGSGLPLCTAFTSNAAKAELLKSSRTQITLVTVSSFYCHLACTSIAGWQKLWDLRGASSPRHQAPKLSLITSTWLNLIISKIFIFFHHPYSCYVYTLHNLFAHSSCTFLLILLFIKSTLYCPAHFILLHIL